MGGWAGYEWPSRQEWAKRQRTPDLYCGHIAERVADEVSVLAADYGTEGEIAAAVRALHERWLLLGRALRRLLEAAEALAPYLNPPDDGRYCDVAERQQQARDVERLLRARMLVAKLEPTAGRTEAEQATAARLADRLRSKHLHAGKK